MHMDSEAEAPPVEDVQRSDASIEAPSTEPPMQAPEAPLPVSETPAGSIRKAPKAEAEGAVGIIYGDVGTSAFNLSVIANLEKMEYVMAEHDTAGWVLGQVMDMQRKTDLSLDRAKMISLGEDVMIRERVTALINVIGYRDERGLLQVPRTPFKAGLPVLKATDDLIKKVIGLKENTPTGAYLGKLFGYDINVEVDINAMVQKHVSILAKTGGGKSFLCGDLVEELMKHDVTVLILDPHGEYGAMRDVGSVMPGKRDFGIQPMGFKDKIMEFATDTTINKDARPLKFTLANIDARDLLALTTIKNGKVYLNALRKAIDGLKAVKKDYGLKEIIAMLESDEDANNQTLIAELAYLNEVNIFAPQGTKIDELIANGKTTIINLKGTPPDIQELIVTRLATAMFELRKLGKVPPMMMIAEEAHNFCPQQGTTSCSKIFRTIAAEGRKFGLGLTIISQRAAKIDKNVLSQCNTQMILKVTNPNDLKAIVSSVEGLQEGMDQEIQRLPIGVALIMGGNIQMPLFVEVRPRQSRHGGESVEIIPSKRL